MLRVNGILCGLGHHVRPCFFRSDDPDAKKLVAAVGARSLQASDTDSFLSGLSGYKIRSQPHTHTEKTMDSF